MSIKAIAVMILLTLFPALCQAANTLYILGVDETGSYSFRPRVMKAVERFIHSLEPGDTLYARRITDKSYIDGDATQLLPVPLQIPQAAPEFTIPAPTNRFDRVAQKKWGQEKSRNEHVRKSVATRTTLLKEAAIRHIAGLSQLKSKMTDINGFFAACADRLNTGNGRYERKVILIASDMKDNCHRKLDFDLAGAEVVVMAFEKDPDPKKTKELREYWTKTLTAMKASQVIFLNLDEDLAMLDISAQ